MKPDTPTADAESPLAIPGPIAKWLFCLLGLLAVVVLLWGQPAGPWVELVYRLCTDGLILAIWLASSLGIGSMLVAVLARRASAEDGGVAAGGDNRVIAGSEQSPPILAVAGHDRLLRLAASVAAGVGVLSLVVLLLGWAGWLTATTAWTLMAAGLLLLPTPAVRRLFASASSGVSPGRWHAAILLLAPVAAMLLLAALTPPGLLWQDEPHPYDVLSYHLQLPREWYELGRIVPLEHNVFGFFPLNVEMHYLLAMHLRGGPFAGMYLAQLMHAAMAMLVPVAIHGGLRPRGRLVASAGAVLAGTNPWLLLLGGVAYNEAGLLLFATLAVVFASRSMDRAGTRKEAILAGLFTGFACGTKLTAVPTVLVAVPVAMTVARLVGRRPVPDALDRSPWRRAIGDLVAFVLAGLLSFSPWLVRNIAWTGNPLFPELAGLFGRAHFTETQVERWRAAHSPRDDQRGIAARADAFLDHAVFDWRGGHVLGGLVLVGVVVGLFRRTRDSVLVATLLLFTLAFWLGFTHLQGRFLVLALPLAALLPGSIPAGWSRGAVAVATVSLAVGIVRAGPQLERSVGVIGLGELAPLLRASLPDERWFDVLIESGRPVTLVGDARAFLYPVPMSRLRYRTVFDVAGDDLRDAYLDPRNGGGMVLVDPGELRRFLTTYRGFPRHPEEWLARQGVFLLEH